MPAPLSRACAPMLLPLLLLLTACDWLPRVTPPAVAPVPVRLPPLPGEARQPACPATCEMPTGSCACLRSLTLQRERWQTMLTEAEPPASPASAGQRK